MGEAGEGQNITHQQKKMNEEALRAFRDRFELEISDEEVEQRRLPPPARGLARDALPARAPRGARAATCRRAGARWTSRSPVPPLEIFESQLEGTGEREISTTMAFVRILAALLRDKKLGPRVVPIVPDESRTFGMEGMFRQLGIYSHVGQLYEPEDAGSLMFYREDRQGQVLQEGITEAGAFSSWIAAATSYSNHDVQMVPFYIFYSMFGFQRIGDLAWAAGDSRARGFLVGGTAGRTTLNGEGLQHEDGHSHLLVLDDPQLRLLRPGLRLRARRDRPRGPAADDRRAGGRLLLPHGDERELPPPALPRGRRGGDPARHAPGARGRRREGAAARLGHDPARGRGGRRPARPATSTIEAEVWSVTSCTELRRDGLRPRPRGAPAPGRRGRVRPGSRECLGGSEAPGGRRHRLHEGGARRDPRLGAGALRRARHRRLRPQRLPAAPAPLLRGRPPPRRRRRPAMRWPTRARDRARRSLDEAISRATRSTPTLPIRRCS